MSKFANTVFVVFLALFIGACGGGGGSNSDPNAGFKLSTYAVSPINSTVEIPTAGNVQGQFLQPNGTPTGTIEFFNQDHGGIGLLVIPGAKVPGLWQFRLAPNFVPGSLCLQATIANHNMSLNSVQKLRCPGHFVGFTASPNSLDALNQPATITFSGKGLENTFGEPALAFYDEFGYVVASTQASQSLWSGDEIEGVVVNLPDISQVYDGIYTIAVHNVRSDGSWDVIGAAEMTIYGNPPPPPPPPPGGGGCEPDLPELSQLPCEPEY